jgi:hypothetical protein
MNKIVRLIALMLALLTLSGMFAACANSNDPETTTEAPTTNAPGEGGGDVTEAETLYVEDDLEDKYEFGETITMLYWEEFRMHEFFAEESGDIIEDAIFHRNIKVAERLGIEFEFIAQPGDSTNHTAYVQQAENDWAADNAYDIYAGYSRTIPLLTIKKMTANLLEQDAFNVNKPWWPEALTTECTIKDQLYFCTGDISTSMLWYMIAFMYNKELYENHIQNGGKTPMDMVDNDEWTLQNFLSLVQDLYIDTNNDGQYDKGIISITNTGNANVLAISKLKVTNPMPQASEITMFSRMSRRALVSYASTLDMNVPVEEDTKEEIGSSEKDNEKVEI